MREDKIIGSEIGNPKRREKIKKNVTASEDTAGLESIKILLNMGGKCLLNVRFYDQERRMKV